MSKTKLLGTDIIESTPIQTMSAQGLLDARDTAREMGDRLRETFINSVFVKDGSFNNPVLKLGLSDEALNAAEFLGDMITFQRGEIIATYHSCWIFRRIVDKVAQDMWSAGISINGDTDPQDVKRILKRLSRLRPELIYATEQARLFGGAASLVMVDDGETDLSKPLDVTKIRKGSAIRLWTTDRWYNLEPGNEVVTNFKSKDFGTPKYYKFMLDYDNGSSSKAITVHHSRVLRWVNRKSTRLMNQRLQGWGISELEHIYQDLKIHENAKNSAGSLVAKALLEIVKVGGMRSAMQGLALGSPASQQMMSGVMSSVMNFRSNDLVFMDSEDSYQRETFSFTGLPDLLDVQKDIIAGAAEMPKVLLYGDTKGGITSDSPAEMEFYAGTILGKQDETCRPVLDKLLPIVYAAEGVQIPNDLDYEFESIASMSQDKKLNILQQSINAIQQMVDLGVMTHETGLEEILQIQKITGFGSNITERDVTLAKQNDTPESAESDGEETIEPMPSMNDDYSDIKDAILGKKTLRDKQ